MMGQHTRSASLFYYFRLEDQVPENHLLRLIDQHIDLGFVREQLKQSYSDTDRPSIDPELLLRILLIAICTGSAASASLLKNCCMRLAWRSTQGSIDSRGFYLSVVMRSAI
jgi:transposase